MNHIPEQTTLDLDLPEPRRGSHTGRPQVRGTEQGGVMLLCPYGHLVTYIRPGEWAGSWAEARTGDPGFTVTCHGAAD